MNPKQRYKELIKENDNAILQLSEDYQVIANAYTKKARGYGTKSLDTEVRIKEVIEELISFDEQHLDKNEAIGNMTDYIENNIKKIAKAPGRANKIKEIIAVSIFILLIAGYFVLNTWLNRKRPLAAPTDITIDLDEEGCFKLTWTYNVLATEGYEVIIYKDGEKLKSLTVDKMVSEGTNTQLFSSKIAYEENHVYIFEITAKGTDDYKESQKAQITYPIE